LCGTELAGCGRATLFTEVKWFSAASTYGYVGLINWPWAKEFHSLLCACGARVGHIPNQVERVDSDASRKSHRSSALECTNQIPIQENVPLVLVAS